MQNISKEGKTTQRRGKLGMNTIDRNKIAILNY